MARLRRQESNTRLTGEVEHTKSDFFHATILRREVRDGFLSENNLIMKKIFNSLAAIALLCAMCFLGGEWPENTPRKKVVTYDGCAMAIVAVCGLYLRKSEKDGRLR